MGKKSRKHQSGPSEPHHWEPVDPVVFAEAFEPVFEFMNELSIEFEGVAERGNKKDIAALRRLTVRGVCDILGRFFLNRDVPSAMYRSLALGSSLVERKLGERQTNKTVEKWIVYAAAIIPLKPCPENEPIWKMMDIEELVLTADRVQVQDALGIGVKKIMRYA